MVRARTRALPRLPGLCRFAVGVAVAGWPLLPGCSHAPIPTEWGGTIPSLTTVPAPARQNAPTAQAGSHPEVRPVEHREPVETLPAPNKSEAVSVPKPLPITFDTVLRLAEEQNPQVGLAREKLHESQTEQEIACKGWLPNVYAGVGYYRHEGGIQNPDGTFVRSSTGALFPGVELRTQMDIREATFARVNTERAVWQQQGELKRVTNEILLEAATTYVDLLTARRGEAIARELEKYQLALLRRAEELQKAERPAVVLTENVRAEVVRRRQALTQLRQQGDAASAKLAYLLGLPPEAELVPLDETLTPIDLVDATAPSSELVARALATGPGVQELEGMIGVIQNGLSLFSSPLRFLPTFQVNMIEGAFGAGPNGSIDWANRFDVGVQARINLTEFVTARERRQVAESRLRQVQLSYDDLRGKVTAGVREAREAIHSGREQIKLGAEHIRHASEGYRLTDLRLKESAPGGSVTDVLQSIGGLERAHYGYLQAVSAYNKAQVRLLLLLGPGTACAKPQGKSQ
jgi:outer membrane protein TolC